MAAEPPGRDPERDRIAAALLELVAERGYQEARVDDILRLAGADPATFERCFPGGLEDCFAAVWEKIDAELHRRMTAAYDSGGDWQDRLRDTFLAGLSYLAEDEARARLYVAEVLYVNEQLRERQQAALERFRATIDLGREGKDEGPPAPPHVADAVSGAIWHRVNQLVRTGRAAALPGELPRFMYLAVLPYRSAAAAEAELRRPFGR